MSNKWLAAVVFSGFARLALAADADPCSRFTWNVTRELQVMQQTPAPVTAARKSGADVPHLELSKLYALQLTPQKDVTFPAQPGKPTLPDSAAGGIVRIHTDKAGAYRVAMTSGHWIDILDGAKVIDSRDFQGARGCEKPRKIVEFDLPGNRDLLLQLSGAAEQKILLSVTAVAGAAG